MSIEVARRLISEECDNVKDLLLRKNKEYGNSALEPKQVFAQGDAEDLIRVRIDDKLKRIETLNQKGVKPEIAEDTEQDLIGYLILLRVARRYGNVCSICGSEGGHTSSCVNRMKVDS